MPTTKLTLTIPDELLERIRNLALQERRSISNYVVYLLARALERKEEK